MRLLRLLLGYRDDLDLGSRWWHRLSLVAFMLSALVLVGITCLIQLTGTRRLRPDDIVVSQNLADFTIQTDKSVPNSIPGFLLGNGLKGKLGLVHSDYDSVSEVAEYRVETGFCSPSLQRFLDDNGEPKKEIIIQNDSPRGSRGTLTNIVDHRGDSVAGRCWMNAALGAKSADEIVIFKVTPANRIGHGATLIGKALMISGLPILLAINIYYRGLVYIIFGKRSDNPMS